MTDYKTEHLIYGMKELLVRYQMFKGYSGLVSKDEIDLSKPMIDYNTINCLSSIGESELTGKITNVFETEKYVNTSKGYLLKNAIFLGQNSIINDFINDFKSDQLEFSFGSIEGYIKQFSNVFSSEHLAVIDHLLLLEVPDSFKPEKGMKVSFKIPESVILGGLCIYGKATEIKDLV